MLDVCSIHLYIFYYSTQKITYETSESKTDGDFPDIELDYYSVENFEILYKSNRYRNESDEKGVEKTT